MNTLIFNTRISFLSFLILVLSVSFIACNQTSKFKPQLETLIAEWDLSTEQLKFILTKVQNNIQSLETIKLSLDETRETMATLPLAKQMTIKEMALAFDTQYNGLKGMVLEIETFNQEWNQGAKTMDLLKAGLAANSLGSEAEAQMEKLQMLVLDFTSKQEIWSQKAEGAFMTALKAMENIRN
ncbi:MAG: hypothetical protein IPI50_08285 [Saprospiraceae bacterium]|nr:hypothetical protein [Saprospiraceae bacterium]